MKLTAILGAVRSIGVRNVLLALPYALRRDAADFAARVKRANAPGPGTEASGTGQPRFAVAAMRQRTPGPLKNVRPNERGALFEFSHATLEVAFLAPDLVRLTFEPGALPVPYSIEREDWGPVSVTVGQDGLEWVLVSSEMSVAVSPEAAVRYADSRGNVLREDFPPVFDRGRWTYLGGAFPNEHYYGLGEKAAPFNLRGGKYRMWNREPMGRIGAGSDPLYLCVPVYLGLHSTGSYLVFFENSHDARFDFGADVRVRFRGGALRQYFVPGPPQRALDRYTELTGRPALPPRWALGYHQARWSYETEAQVREVVEGFVKRKLPVGAIHLDIHHMDGYRNFTVDPNRFPDMASLSRDLASRQIRLVSIIDAGVKADPEYDVYNDGCGRDAFLRLSDGRHVTAPVWPGMCVFPDFTKPSVREWWGGFYKRCIDWGMAGVWHDMNEPAAFAAWGAPTLPLSARHDMEGRGGDHREAHNVYALLEARAAHGALRKLAPKRRPWILSRSGWAGLQRFAWNWTGDCKSDWWTVRQSVRIALGMGLSGIPYSGPDIGGFTGDPSPELYVRWFQAASFLPFFRTHSAAFVKRREPWSFGEEALEDLRPSLELRYRLMPYWYTAAWQASTKGLPLVRPMFFEAPGDKTLCDLDDQFMVGDHLLVAPICDEGKRSRGVVLPAGEWCEFWSGATHDGSSTVSIDAPLNRVPILVRKGAMIPMLDSAAAEPMPGQPRPDVGLTFHVFLSGAPAGGSNATSSGGGGRPVEDPGRGASKLRPGVLSVLYSDAGDGYEQGRVDTFTLMAVGANEYEIFRAADGEFPFSWPQVALEVHGAPIASLAVDGATAVPTSPGRFPIPALFSRIDFRCSKVDGR